MRHDPDAACWRCRYFVELSEDETATEETGECRRYPPQLTIVDDEVMSAFPGCGYLEWCGEFREVCDGPEEG